MSTRDGLWLVGEFRDDEPVIKADGFEAPNVRRLVILVAKQGGVVEAQRLTFFPKLRNGEPSQVAAAIVGLAPGTKVMVRVEAKCDLYRPSNPRVDLTAWEVRALLPAEPAATPAANGKAPASATR